MRRQMTHALRRKLTYDDLLAMPDDGLRREILDGELVVTPAPSPMHQRASKRLYAQLEAYFEGRGLGEVFFAPLDTILAPHDVVEPDLLVVTDPATISARAVEGAPAVVIEILSPSTASTDRRTKAARYAACGVPHYWIVDPERHTIECLRLEGGDYVLAVQAEGVATLTHPDWPGLNVRLQTLWT